jgi:hypothetical protein
MENSYVVKGANGEIIANVVDTKKVHNTEVVKDEILSLIIATNSLKYFLEKEEDLEIILTVEGLGKDRHLSNISLSIDGLSEKIEGYFEEYMFRMVDQSRLYMDNLKYKNSFMLYRSELICYSEKMV